MSRKALVVINPSSRDFEAQRRWPQLRALLEASGELSGVLETEPDESATRRKIGEAVGPAIDRVIAAGGDGTIHTVINAVLASGRRPFPEFAFVPFGTANDVAKSLDLPLGNLEKLAAIAMGDDLRRLDVGRVRVLRDRGVEVRNFIDAVTIGMDADVLERRSQYRDLKGYLSYVPAIAERVLEQQSMDVRVTIDDMVLDERVFNLIINNVPVYAGELKLPDSKPDDGLLDVYLFNRIEYASKFVAFALRQADFLKLGVGEALDDLTENQRSYHGRIVSVRLASPRQVQVDGEIFGEAQGIEAEVGEQLKVAAPPKASERG